MNIGDRLRALREQKKFSQGDIEKRTGLLRCYISRVENGHAVPAIETLEKFARALEVPVYHLVYDVSYLVRQRMKRQYVVGPGCRCRGRAGRHAGNRGVCGVKVKIGSAGIVNRIRHNRPVIICAAMK